MSRRLLIPLLAVASACSDKSGDSVGDTDPCAGEPTVTWSTWGQGFLTENCQTCHASTSPDRDGAPETVVFDTEEEVLAQASLILSVATGDAPSMPPEGGISDEDRALLEIWLTCSIP